MTTRSIKFIDLSRKYAPLARELQQDLERVVSSGSFILGDELEAFEADIVEYMGSAHAVGVGNGTDALMLCLRAAGVGPGDEVITSPMSYLATASCIALVGATAVFVDVDESLNLDPAGIGDAVTRNTKAILPVHLSGIPANLHGIAAVADEHGLPIIEDCAQSFGAVADGKFVGTSGRFGVTSFHPLKNLGALGDAGMILARDGDDAVLKADEFRVPDIEYGCPLVDRRICADVLTRVGSAAPEEADIDCSRFSGESTAPMVNPLRLRPQICWCLREA